MSAMQGANEASLRLTPPCFADGACICWVRYRRRPAAAQAIEAVRETGSCESVQRVPGGICKRSLEAIRAAADGRAPPRGSCC
jgi:hypothetical protein